MTKTSRDITKSKRPAQAGTPIMVRMQPEQLARLDAWADAQEDDLSRPEAIRRLVDWGLKATVLTGR